ncbi:MAG: extracellular solute-binding protein [Planctomycetaceae bacterium]|nr:extracellular solute-binding protein [Planctomycetaceae bacterium]
MDRVSLRHRLLTLLIVATLAGPGCGSNDRKDQSTRGDKPFAGARLVIAVPPGSNMADRWQSLLIEWSARTGAEAEIKELLVTGDEKPADKVRSAPAVEPDLMIFPITALPDLNAAGRLAPVPMALQQEESGLQWNDFPRGLVSNVLQKDRIPVAVPIACPVPVLYYRKDLLAKAGQFPPETWDDYQRLLDTLDRWAPGLSAAEPWGEGFRATMFLARSVAYARHPENFSLLFDIQTGDPLIQSEGWTRGLDAAMKALPKLHEDSLKASPADCRRLILEGKVALAVAYETPAGEPSTPAASAQSAIARANGISLGIVRLPGSREVFNRASKRWDPAPNGINRPSLTAFAGLAAGVSTKSSDLNAQAAWNLIVTLSDPAVFAAAFSGDERTLCRMSQTEEGRAWFGAELTDGEGAEFLQATAEALQDARLTPEFPIVRSRAFRTLLAEGLNESLNRKTTPAETLAAVQKSWGKLVEETGRDRLRDSYRRQFGLSEIRTDR